MVHHRTGKEKSSTQRATCPPTVVDLAWAAGFLEGEGTFYGERPAGGCLIAAEQIEKEPILRLLAMFGGNTYKIDRARNVKRFPTERPRLKWAVSGSRARGIALTLYTWMSPKRREQIRAML